MERDELRPDNGEGLKDDACRLDKCISACMHACMYICIYVHVYVYVCTCIYEDVYRRVWLYIYMSVYTCMCVSMFLHVCIYLLPPLRDLLFDPFSEEAVCNLPVVYASAVRTSRIVGQR